MSLLSAAEGYARSTLLLEESVSPSGPWAICNCGCWQKGIKQAWKKVKEGQPHWSAVADEPSLNVFTETELNYLRRTDAVWRTLVSRVSRGPESMNFNGEWLETRPDLCLYLSDGSRPFPLVVECKLIDSGSKKTVALYCAKGIKRFINGDYGWTGRESFMLAYVRDGADIAGCLMPYLAATPSLALSAAPVSDPSGAGVTVHGRAFSYSTKSPPDNLPGTIFGMAFLGRVNAGSRRRAARQAPPRPVACFRSLLGTPSTVGGVSTRRSQEISVGRNRPLDRRRAPAGFGKTTVTKCTQTALDRRSSPKYLGIGNSYFLFKDLRESI